MSMEFFQFPLAGLLVGSLLGAHFGGKLPDNVLRLTIAVMLALVGLKMLMR